MLPAKAARPTAVYKNAHARQVLFRKRKKEKKIRGSYLVQDSCVDIDAPLVDKLVDALHDGLGIGVVSP